MVCYGTYLCTFDVLAVNCSYRHRNIFMYIDMVVEFLLL